MNAKALEWAALVGVLSLWLPAAAPAQSKTPKPDPSKSHAHIQQTLPAPADLPLKDVGMVSTEEAARAAAAAKASDAKSGRVQLDGVSRTLELHPLKDGAVPATESKDFRERKKRGLKDIHGSVYGAAAGQGSAERAGGDVGASSGNGKLNIYVQGEHAQAGNAGTH